MNERRQRSSAIPASRLRTCACFNLRKAARAVTQLYDEALRPSGLRATQFSLLGVIHSLGTANITGLAEEAVLDRTTLTRNLNLLEREGLVRIQPGKDGRVREVTLTGAGERKLANALPHWEWAQAEMHARIGTTRLEGLLSGLSMTVRAARGD